MTNKPQQGITLGQQIKERREQLGMTQAQLAKRAGTTQPAIAMIESGQHQNLRLSTIEKIAAVLNLNPIIWLRPEKSYDQILDERSTQLAKWIIADSAGSTALEGQLPPPEFLEKETQRIKEYLLKDKSKLWHAK